MSASSRAEETRTTTDPVSAVSAAQAPAGAAALAGLAPQQRLALQLQGAGGNAGVARMLGGGAGLAGPGGPGGPVASIIPMPSAAVARTPAAAPAAPGAAPQAEEEDSWVTSAILSVVREIPGYDVATLIAGADPITGRAVAMDRRTMVEKILGHGPFAAGIGPVLATLDVIDEVIAVVTDGLAAHQLSFARIRKDFSDCWDEISLIDGVDANVAIVRRYVDRFVADVRAFASEIADRLIEMVRAAAAKVAEPLLQRPEIAPVWNLAKKVMKYDPLKGEAVQAPTVEILADFLRLIGQEQRLAQMQERGTLQKTADWLDTQFSTFADILAALRQLFSDAWAAISPSNLPRLLDTLPELAQRAFGIMGRIRDFATTVIGTVLRLVKEALIGMLAEHADKIPGFRLLTVILGRNPFTGEAVSRTATNLIRGFITLLPGGEAIYDQLAESGVIESAAGRIEGAIDRLGISWDLITGTFRGIWDSLSLNDLLDPIGAFMRILDRFGEPLARITAFVGEVVQAVVELILAAMNFPSDLLGSIIANAKRAYADIKKDPVGFLKNVLAALKEGMSGFLSNIVGYLKDGLAGWLTRGLGKAGVQLPTDWSMSSILKLVLDVLGIGIEKLWEKLGRKIGPEKVAKIRGVIGRLEGAWVWIRDVMERGVGALWDHLAEQVGNLWDTLLGMARDWVMGELIEKALARLVSMLDPTGIMAIIRSAQAFFNAIQSAIEYLRDILAIVNDYVSTLAEVAAGNISAGAAKMEKGLAGAIPIALGFLANQVGITDVPEKIAEIIGKLREMVDQALDWLVDKAWSMGQRALAALGIGGDGPADPAAPDGTPDGPQTVPKVEAPVKDEEGKGHTFKIEGAPGEEPRLMVHSTPTPFDVYLGRLKLAMADKPTDTADIKAQRKAGRDALQALEDGDLKLLTEEARGVWRNFGDPNTSKPDGLLARVSKLAAQVTAVAEMIAGGSASGDPQAPAPGIGERQLHKDKPPSHRDGHPLHWLESEHVVPFTLVNRLWAVAGALMPDRAESGEDKHQTTVMIYFGAAREKTPADLSAADAFDAVARDFMRRAERFREQGKDPDSGEYRAFAADFVGAIRSAKDSAIARTNVAIQNESNLVMPGSTRSNKQRRALPGTTEEPLAPTAGQVREAADAQLSDASERLTAAFHAARNERLAARR